MESFQVKARSNQQGAVLVTSLIVLVVLTLFVTSMLKTSILEMKIGGVSRWASTNFAQAEFALMGFLNVNNGNFAPGATLDTTAPTFGEGSVAVTATEITCAIDAGVGSGNMMNIDKAPRAVFFDVQADATYLFSARVVLHQGIKSRAAPAACT